MQMVLSIGDWQWSPSVWKYKEWGGLYSKPNAEGKPLQLYVNIGLGEVALPFRLGATPEVTLLTLKTK
jgi:predicted MPP superfamily phosphohydrolase